MFSGTSFFKEKHQGMCPEATSTTPTPCHTHALVWKEARLGISTLPFSKSLSSVQKLIWVTAGNEGEGFVSGAFYPNPAWNTTVRRPHVCPQTPSALESRL